MKKIVILGCENSHANAFLDFIVKEKAYADVEVVGVYSDEKDAMEKLAGTYGVPTMSSYDELAREVDGVIVTARHGDNHLKYAAPYLPSGVPTFIDKPITVSEQDALALARALKENGVRVTGGSSCRYDKTVLALKEEAENGVGGKTLGGFVRCPISMQNDYGGFYFYSQHLVEITGEIFGRFPKAVKAFVNGEKYTIVFRYEDFDVVGLYLENYYSYYACRAFEEGTKGGELDISSYCFRAEFDAFYRLLCGGEQEANLEEFIAPVYVLNGIARALASGEEEKIEYPVI